MPETIELISKNFADTQDYAAFQTITAKTADTHVLVSVNCLLDNSSLLIGSISTV